MKVIVLTLFLLFNVVATQNLTQSCNWTLTTCAYTVRTWPRFYFKCEAQLNWTNTINGLRCNSSNATMITDEVSRKYCETFPCRIIPVLCPWTAWQEPSAYCGSESGILTRKQDKCCNPLSYERIRICTSTSVKQTKSRSWKPCTSGSVENTSLPMIVSLSVFLPIVFIIIAVCIFVQITRCFHSRSSAPQTGQAAPVYSVYMSQVTLGNNQQGQNNPAFSNSVVNSDAHVAADNPPSYDEVHSNNPTNSDMMPPAYNEALGLSV